MGTAKLSPAEEARRSALAQASPEKWVALSADESRVVAEGDTYAEVVVNAERAGETDPLILRVPEDWTPRVF